MSDAPERLKISRGMVQFLAATQNRTEPDDPEYFRAPTVTPDKEPVRHEDGIPHQSHRWVTACDSERGMCADCGVDIEDDEALEPCTTTAAPDVEAAPDLARPEDLSQWLRRGALWALGYVPDEHGSEVDAAPRYLGAHTVTPDVKAALEMLEYMETGPAEGDHGDAAALVASTLRALAAERDALRARVAELEGALTQASQAGLRAMDHVEEQAGNVFALRARVAELEEVAQTVVDVIDGVEIRCMAVDGPVTPTREEITDDELRAIYHPAARALTRAGEEIGDEAWTCPECAFRFGAEHEDEGGGYSCPNCAEAALRTRVEELEKVVAETLRQLDYNPTLAVGMLVGHYLGGEDHLRALAASDGGDDE